MGHSFIFTILRYNCAVLHIFATGNFVFFQRQWTRLRKLIEMAQRAGLMPGKVNLKIKREGHINMLDKIKGWSHVWQGTQIKLLKNGSHVF